MEQTRLLISDFAELPANRQPHIVYEILCYLFTVRKNDTFPLQVTHQGISLSINNIEVLEEIKAAAMGFYENISGVSVSNQIESLKQAENVTTIADLVRDSANS